MVLGAGKKGGGNGPGHDSIAALGVGNEKRRFRMKNAGQLKRELYPDSGDSGCFMQEAGNAVMMMAVFESMELKGRSSSRF